MNSELCIVFDLNSEHGSKRVNPWANHALLLCIAMAALLFFSAAGYASSAVLEQARQLRVEDPQAALALLDQHIRSSVPLEAPDSSEAELLEQAELLEFRARIHRDSGDYQSAAVDATRLEQIAQTLNTPLLLADAQFLSGSIRAERGDIAGALDRFHAARRTLEGTVHTAELARVINALGVTHNFTEDFSRAREYFEQALKLVRQTDHRFLESTVLGNRAMVIAELDGAQAGLKAHREALTLATELEDAEAVANQMANICSRLIQTGQLNQARTNCNDALERVTALDKSRLIAGTRMSLGDLDVAQGNLEEAREDYQAALDRARDKIPSVEVLLLQKLADLERNLNQPQQALEYLDQLMAVNDRLMERERSAMIEDLEVRYRIEQQAQAMDLLALDHELQTAELRQRNLMLIGTGMALLLVSLLLIVAWRGFSAKSRLQRELANRNSSLGEALETITLLAREDELTGLLNRRGFSELANRELRRRSRTDEPLAVVMADIDNFKHLNDSYGHAVGDEILSQLAECITGALRELDIVCRWGGEEFVFLLPRTSQAEAFHVIKRLRQRIVADSLKTSAGEFEVSLTYGIAMVNGDINAAIERADHAMYRGKKAGRDQVVAETPGDKPDVAVKQRSD